MAPVIRRARRPVADPGRPGDVNDSDDGSPDEEHRDTDEFLREDARESNPGVSEIGAD